MARFAFVFLLALINSARVLALTQAEADVQCQEDPDFGPDHQAVLSSEGEIDACVAKPKPYCPPSQKYKDAGGKSACCPRGNSYSVDSASGQGGCCPAGNSYSVDTASGRGSCCPTGSSYSVDAPSGQASCCPSGASYTFDAVHGLGSCCTSGKAFTCSCQPVKPSCPSAEGKIYTTNCVDFKLFCGKGFWTTTIRSTTAETLTDCVDQCGQEPKCQGVDWRASTKTCVLKSEWVAAPTVSDADVMSAITVENRLTCPKGCKPADAAPEEKPTCPSGNGRTITEGGVVFTLKCSTYHALTDLTTAPGNSPAECAKACADNPACQGVDFGRAAKTCYLKSEVIGSTSQVSEAYDALVLSQKRPDTSTPPPAPAPTCPSGNGKTITEGGVVFTLKCSTYHGLVNLAVVPGNSPAECAKACVDNPACQGVDFGRAAKTCSLKSEVIGSTSQASEAYDALVLSQKRPATSAPPPAPAEKPTCPDGNGKTYTANGVEFKLHCDKTITGNEIKRIAATSSGTCLEECAAMPACQGYDYIRFSKACSLKGTYTANPAANTGRECWVPTKQR